MKQYSIQDTIVKDHKHGYSYNLTSKIDAEHLCTTLNDYETTLQTYTTLNNKLDKITKQVIQLKLTINTLHEEIEYLNKMVKE